MAAPSYKEPQSPAFKQKSTAATTISLGWVDSKAFSWFPAVSFAFMLYCSLNAIIQSKGDPGTIAFVVGSFSLLGGLFWSMREFEKIQEKTSPKKGRLKIAIWVLAMALNVLFSYRVTSILESTVMSVTVWTIAAFTAITGCYLLFFYQEAATPASAAPSSADAKEVALDFTHR